MVFKLYFAEPTICNNDYNYMMDNGTYYSYFICPLDDEDDSYTFCCGPDDREHCCSVFQKNSETATAWSSWSPTGNNRASWNSGTNWGSLNSGTNWGSWNSGTNWSSWNSCTNWVSWNTASNHRNTRTRHSSSRRSS